LKVVSETFGHRLNCQSALARISFESRGRGRRERERVLGEISWCHWTEHGIAKNYRDQESNGSEQEER